MTRLLCFRGLRLENARRLRRLLPEIFALGGGFLPTLRKALRIFRREGAAGFRSRLIFIRRLPACAAGSGNDYREWVRRHDRLSPEIRLAMTSLIPEFKRRPLISVLMPVHDPDPRWLDAAVGSVRNQLYPHWQLCIADDCSADPAIRRILEDYGRNDPRIRIHFREENGHISTASNSALELASGEWAALLDHDDLLAEHALFWVAEAVNRHPEAQLVYSDEDKIDGRGRRFAPYFKCDWNQDLFYSHNLITHLGVYRASRVRSLGGFRRGFEGAQDYDLALRYIESIPPEQIIHVPRILYHWRIHPRSTAFSADAKPYASHAGEKALNEHFIRAGVAATAEQMETGYRVRYALPPKPPPVTVIIPTRNGSALLERCVSSLLGRTCYPDFEVLIMDNGSDDPGTVSYLKGLESLQRVRVERDNRPFNYSALNNRAAEIAGGELIALLNDDIEVITPRWLAEMVSIALQPGVGAVGARLWYPDGTLQHGGVILGAGGIAGHAHRFLKQGEPGYLGRAVLQQSFSAVTGACLVVRKELFRRAGGLDEKHLPIAFNDVDFCLRLRELGFRNVWTPHAELYHHESATRGREDTREKHARFAGESEYMQRRWGDLLFEDPAYSPNLSLARGDFSLAWPPRLTPLPAPSPLPGGRGGNRPAEDDQWKQFFRE